MPISLGELATRFGCDLDGDPDIAIDNVASLTQAGPRSLCFFSNSRLSEQLSQTRAAAVIVRVEHAADAPCASLITTDPYACFARIATFLNPLPKLRAGIHASAVVHASAKVAASAEVAANVVIDENAVIGEGVYIAPGSYVGRDCKIGEETRLLANVTLARNVSIGARCIMHPGVVIGADGFGNAPSADGWLKVPQLGGVRIGDDVEIGANSTVDCGAFDDTVLGDGVRIDNLCMVGHNAIIGDHTAMASMVGVAGSVKIGRHCLIAGQVGIAGHIEICDGVMINGQGMVTKSINKPGVYASSFPVEDVRTWNRRVARFRRLDSFHERIKTLEENDS